MRTLRLTVVGAIALALPLLASATGDPAGGAKGAASAPWLDLPGLPAGCDGIVRSLHALADGRIVVGGTFSSCGGVAAANIATWQPATGAFAPLGAGVGAGSAPVIPAVSALAVIGDGLFVGGSFAEAGGVAASNIARYDLVAGTWSALAGPSAEGISGDVLALAAVGTALYVGGNFEQVAGGAARHLARFDADSGTWSALAGRPNAPVRALASAGTLLFAGGEFSIAGSVGASRVARLDTTTGTWSALGAGVDGTVHAIALHGDTVFVGGEFRAAGGVPANLVAAYATGGGAWSALARSGGQGLDGGSIFLRRVRALAVAEGELLATGDFTVADRDIARHLARVDPRTRAWQPVGAAAAEGMDGPGLAIAVAGRQAFVGGGFRRAGGAPRGGLAALYAPEGLFADGFEVVPAR